MLQDIALSTDSLMAATIVALLTALLTYVLTIKSAAYKQELQYRERAAKISELFACWIKYSPTQLQNLTPQEKSDYYEKLNRLTWELTLWVSDDKIVKAIMDKLAHKSDQNIKEIMLSIRKTLHKTNGTSQLKWEDIVHFSVED